ncbi:MAG: class I SAM-dependent methyltransferase [Novosphingobium sp.]|nr:class I SAM-dependent methyltransferase [Novosphingobium sp.]
MPSDGSRQYAPAAARNRGPILNVLRAILPSSGLVLEVASGTGEHVVHFARAFPLLKWQPSDPSREARSSIDGWIAAEGTENVDPPLDLDAASDSWPVDHAAAVVCINMIHISPWASTEGLMRGASRILDAGAPLYLYGPFRRATRPIEPSNAAFDEDLRSRDPRWGLRDLDEVAACAGSHGFILDGVAEMPANNLSVIFRRS